jgi:imidazoleglycerol phosphate synthase glutamine amidotransferase subunit HisH
LFEIGSRRTGPISGFVWGFNFFLKSSEEAPGVRGLGVLKGKVVKFKLADRRLKVPHMGWNEVHPVGTAGRSGKKCCRASAHFYFVHSFFGRPADPSVVWRPRPTGKIFVRPWPGETFGHAVSSGKKRPDGPSFLEKRVGARFLNPR